MTRARPGVPMAPAALIRAACGGSLVAWLAAMASGQEAQAVEAAPEARVSLRVRDHELVAANASDLEIGDPWWDDLESGRGPSGGRPDAGVAGDPDISGDARLPNEQIRRRVASQRGQRAMSAPRVELSLVRQACPEPEKAARAEMLAAAPFTTLLEYVRVAVAAAIELHAGAAGSLRARLADDVLDPPQWRRLRGHVDRWGRVAIEELGEQAGRKALAGEPNPFDAEEEP